MYIFACRRAKARWGFVGPRDAILHALGLVWALPAGGRCSPGHRSDQKASLLCVLVGSCVYSFATMLALTNSQHHLNRRLPRWPCSSHPTVPCNLCGVRSYLKDLVVCNLLVGVVHCYSTATCLVGVLTLYFPTTGILEDGRLDEGAGGVGPILSFG